MATPAQAGNFLKPMHGLFSWAIGLEYIEKNPCDGVKAPKLNNSLGFEAWTEQDVDKYEAKWTEGTKERVWDHVLLHNECVATPDQAGNFLKPMRGLFNWVIGLEYTEKNPCDGVKAPKLNNSLGFDAWTEQDVDKYEAKWTEGTKERVWLHVLLHKN